MYTLFVLQVRIGSENKGKSCQQKKKCWFFLLARKNKREWIFKTIFGKKWMWNVRIEQIISDQSSTLLYHIAGMTTDISWQDTFGYRSVADLLSEARTNCKANHVYIAGIMYNNYVYTCRYRWFNSDSHSSYIFLPEKQ